MSDVWEALNATLVRISFRMNADEIRQLLQVGQLARAEGELRAWVQREPQSAEAHFLLGACLGQAGQLPTASACLETALRLQPALDDAYFALGTALLRAGALSRAEAALAEFTRRRPDNAWAWNNLGLCQKSLGSAVAAVESFRRAISADPTFDLAYANLSNALMLLGSYEQARAACDAALRIRPDNAYTRWNLGLCRLLLGEWPQAWDDFEARWQQPDHPLFAPRGFFHRLRWNGEEPRNRTIFLHAEQGLGDTLQFCRYALELSRRGARVILEVPTALRSLLARSLGPDVRVLARGEPIPPFDAHCPLLSLPRAFRTTVASIPAAVPYLEADPQRVRHWQELLGEATKPRVAIVWSSGASNVLRNVPLAELAALTTQGCEWLGLQVELMPGEEELLAKMPGLRWLGREIVDFGDTAALLAVCHHVVSVDTATAHLAGAMARPIEVLLPFCADWRWLLERQDSPWYPTARLHRQRRPGDWFEPIAMVRESLGRRLEAWPGRD